MNTAYRLASVAATALALTVPTTAISSAQNVIPGDLEAGKVVITWLPGVTVTVTQPSTSTVNFALQNASGRSLTCNGPENNSGIGATATVDRVAQAAVQYYANFPYKTAPQDRFGSTGNVSPGDDALTVDIGWSPILGFLPTGSVAPFLGDAYAARDWISRQHSAATVKGHTGTTGSFSVNNGSTHNGTIPLGPPTNGARTDVSAGVYLVCTSGSDAFAFAGYENGPPSPTNAGTLPIGSTGNR